MGGGGEGEREGIEINILNWCIFPTHGGEATFSHKCRGYKQKIKKC